MYVYCSAWWSTKPTYSPQEFFKGEEQEICWWIWSLYAFFWVIPRRLNFICRSFGTLCLFHLHRQVDVWRILHTTTCLRRWKTDCSETSAYKIQTPGNNPEESIQHLQHGKRLKSRIWSYFIHHLRAMKLYSETDLNGTVTFPSSS